MKTMMIVLLAGAISSCFAGDGWTPLFNGKDFTGWSFDVIDDSAPETIWSIADGEINVAGKGKANGVMRTEKSYSDYELEFEWRWPNAGGNSGCLIHCSEPRRLNVWPKSIEVQLASENAGDFWLIGEHIEVEDNQIAPPRKGQPSRRRLNLTDDSEKPLGEWNTIRIVAKGKTVDVFVNGTQVQKGWDASVSEGAICLQAERADIQFRNIRIKE